MVYPYMQFDVDTLIITIIGATTVRHFSFRKRSDTGLLPCWSVFQSYEIRTTKFTFFEIRIPEKYFT